MEAQRPEAACDPPVAARFDFASPRLMLLTCSHSCSQVKLSEFKVGKQQCKLHLQARALLQLLWWQLHAPCSWNVSCAIQIPNAPQRCRWISQSRGSAILKPQEAFRRLSEAVAVACVMSAAKDQLVTRIPDANPGLKGNIAW